MAASVFLSRFMGLIRDKVISYYFGAGVETDLYNASFAIPDLIHSLLAGGYFSITLIPLLTQFFKEDEEKGWAFFSATLWWISLAALAFASLAWIFAPALGALIVPGLSDPLVIDRLTVFLKIALPAQVCILSGSCFNAVLMLRRQFALPALTPLVYNGCTITGGIICVHFFPERGMEGFSWGVFAGAVLGFLVLPALAVRAGGLRFKAVLFHPGLKPFLLLAFPLMLGQSIVMLDEQMARVFGSFGQEGSISYLSYSRRIMMVPVGVVTQSIGVAAYPFLASLAASGDISGFNRTVNRVMLASLAVIIPLSFWMMSAAGPTIRLIFQQGMFSAENTESMSVILVIMLWSAPLWNIQQTLGRGFYARRNTLTPVLAGTVSTLLAIPLYWFLSVRYGVLGVAVSGVSGMALYTFLMLRRWNSHFGGEAVLGLGKRLALLLGLSLPCALLSRFSSDFTDALLPSVPLLAAFLSLCVSFAVFSLSFSILCRLTAPFLWKETLDSLRKMVKKKA
jgi:putative peptidoglycan lipid II flippase